MRKQVARRGSAARGQAVVRGGATKAGAASGPMPAENPADEGAELARIVERFRARFPADWEDLRLCPLQHGIETILERLRVPR